MSTNIDISLESFEFEMNLLVGVSNIITDTWQASLPLHGLETLSALGSDMFTKFWMTFDPVREIGRLALMKYLLSN
jgi:hypothetical protein